MNLYWLEQTGADVPIGNSWLGPWETARFDGFRFAKRRADWRLGRWTAKQAVAFCLNLRSDADALIAIEIRAAASGAPEVFINNRRAPSAISLSHREGRALCAVGRADVRVGCDLEAIECHSDEFIADYFTAEEQRLVASSSPNDRLRTVALLWSAKESTLKVLQEGLRLDTRALTGSFDHESPLGEGWGQLQVRYGDQVFPGWWQEADHLVRTIVADTPSNPPICLTDRFCSREGIRAELAVLMR